MDPECIFCKIVNGEIPSKSFYETDTIFAFMDIAPLSPGHCLVIPKEHSSKLHQISDIGLSEILVTLKRIAQSLNIENYNILQNNGKIAHQEVMHVHFHLIPKPSHETGLELYWNSDDTLDQDVAFEKLKIDLN